MFVYFFLGWCVSVLTRKYAWIDFFWASSFLGVLVLLYRPGVSLSFMAMATAYGLWSARLSLFLWSRIVRKNEDLRYQTLKDLGPRRGLAALWLLYMVEALLTIVLCLPLYLQLTYPSQELGAWRVMGLVIFAVGLLGEAVADGQKAAFKRKTENANTFCQTGLWRYSRHPNYFFELLIWFSYGVYGLGQVYSELYFVPFVVMYVFICKVTGVPPAEKLALSRYGDLYRSYQNRTNKLILWFPMKEK